MTSRHDPMSTVLETLSFSDQHKILAVERTMRGTARYLQGYLRNVPIQSIEKFTDEELRITHIVKVADILAVKDLGRPRERQGSLLSH
jgi:hypothetical protein